MSGCRVFPPAGKECRLLYLLVSYGHVLCHLGDSGCNGGRGRAGPHRISLLGSDCAAGGIAAFPAAGGSATGQSGLCWKGGGQCHVTHNDTGRREKQKREVELEKPRRYIGKLYRRSNPTEKTAPGHGRCLQAALAYLTYPLKEASQ